MALPPVTPLSPEWAILQFLKNWTPEDVEYAIKNNVDLAQLFRENRSVTNGLGWIARRNAEKVADFMNSSNVLYWFRERRPDLHDAIIRTPGGVSWLYTNFEAMRLELGI